MTNVQFFVRLISGRTLVLFANSTDPISSVFEKIQSRTSMIMSYTMSLIYQGKQLERDQTLEACGVENDSELILVIRMQSTLHPKACVFINNNLVPYILSLCKNPLTGTTRILKGLRKFFDTWKMTNYAEGLLKIFRTSSAPKALVMLYTSHRIIGNDAIRLLVSSINANFKDKDGKDVVLPDPTRHQCALIVSELCKWLGMYAWSGDSLYTFCRDSLRVMVTKGEEDMMMNGLLGIHKIFPLAEELAIKMSRNLCFIYGGPSMGDIRDFRVLLVTLIREITRDPTIISPIKIPFNEELSRLPAYLKKKIMYFRGVFLDLLYKFDTVLKTIEENMDSALDNFISMYLPFFKQLTLFSKLYRGCNEIFLDTMKQRKRAICYLIVKHAKRGTDDCIDWILGCKELMEFDAKRHLALMMLPELNNYGEPFHMSIKRSNLLAESFEKTMDAHPDALRAGLFIKFKKEGASGPGVLREWFVLVCEEIFNSQNALFVACSNDRRRFLPNPVSKVNPGHLQYFRFCGRVIALALMHKIHIGIVLDRSFVLQLAGHSISLEDIRDTDPCFYNSCKQILEMDAEIVDQDALGLTFVYEIEEFGKRKSVELCAGGNSMVVNSKNRMQYVESLIKQRFVTYIGEQVEHFARGFADIAGHGLQKSFFKCLDLEDLDRMLRGSEDSISVDVWRAHTDYHGFKETDSEISWFWEAVGGMTEERKRVLLYFWTSVKYLPIEGFGGLASRLHIHKSDVPSNRLPKSHTCFFQLCFPSYPSLSITRDRLSIITQEHVGCSFGIL